MIGNKADALKWLIDQPDQTFEVKVWHPKRSLTANNYYWALLSHLAEALRTSNDELHEIMLERYGVVEGTLITVKADVPLSRIEGHWMLYKSDGKWNAYVQLLGSSKMDSAQFSALLDGLISECREQGIETMPETEIQRLKGYVCTSERRPA